MHECPICKGDLEEWEVLCKSCWLDTNVSRLRGMAKKSLLDLIRELCRMCDLYPTGKKPQCSECQWKERERIVRELL